MHPYCITIKKDVQKPNFSSFHCHFIVTIRTDFRQDMESMSEFTINTLTENYWLIYAAAVVITTLQCAVLWPCHSNSVPC